MNKTVRKEFECQADYILPDYMGDVKKILSYSATVAEGGRFVTESEAELTGSVCFTILYSDADGKLTPISHPVDYDVSLPIDTEGANEVIPTTRVTNLSVRANGPRKISIKAVGESSACVQWGEDMRGCGSAFEDGRTPEVATRVILSEEYKRAESEEHEYAEEILRLDGVSADGLEIIATSGSVRIVSTEVRDGAVSVKGEIILVAIVKTDEQPPFAIKKVVPFEESITLEGVTEEMLTSSEGSISAVSGAVSESDDGCVLNLSCKLRVACLLGRNESQTVLSDAYLKNYNTACEYEDFSYNRLVSMGACEYTCKVKSDKESLGLENPREIIWSSAEARSIEKTVTGNGFNIKGEIVLSCVACEINEYSQPFYTPFKLIVPFDENVNCSCQVPQNSSLDVRITPISVNFSLENDFLEPSVLVCVCYKVCEPCSVKRVTACNLISDEELKKCDSVITVYYPDPKESLFDIAKNHHTSVLKLCADNGISEAVISDMQSDVRALGIKKIIIA